MSLVPSITQGQTNAVEPVKSHNHGPRRNTPVPLPFTVGSQPPVGPSHHVPVNQPLKTTTSHPVFKPSSNATQRPRGYAHDINKQPVAAKRVASDSNSGLNLSLHQMDQSHLTPSYGVDSKLRAECGNRRKHCLENHTAQPPLAELPQNPDRTAPAAEAAFKVGQFTEHVTHAEPSGLIGDSKGNSSPGVKAAEADKTATGESQLVESMDRPTKRQRFCTGIRSDLPPECLDHSLLPVKWSHYAMSGTIALGVDCTYAEEKLEKALRQIGFVDIEIKKYRWPFGSWMANECQSSDRERLRMMGDSL
ncbi:uncharacterized protein PpBr36_11038 [Pyricularia pennisetigena]|uniref:uncharacterized protein n=1 Tax=Pyricularia pennisetigena TaxID=1578925 RepID=UPI00114D50ED|nr:uncharacterized protein PpBr36_11038 [Pyricularia pennisetigena]TLS20692.1 hypothetical protein PpBr36_11038 [Pyricularia pennisetigena]